jgi:hypothetical protein
VGGTKLRCLFHQAFDILDGLAFRYDIADLEPELPTGSGFHPGNTHSRCRADQR